MIILFLESLTGDDWSNLIEYLLPKHPDVYQKVHANLQLKVIWHLIVYIHGVLSIIVYIYTNYKDERFVIFFVMNGLRNYWTDFKSLLFWEYVSYNCPMGTQLMQVKMQGRALYILIIDQCSVYASYYIQKQMIYYLHQHINTSQKLCIYW